MKKQYGLNIRGKKKEWIFLVWEDSKYLDEWRADGLQIDEVVNIIPQWWVDLGLSVKFYCWIQDLLNDTLVKKDR